LILKAFSTVLHQAANEWIKAKEQSNVPPAAFNARLLLFGWLTQQLQTPLPAVPNKQAYDSLEMYHNKCTERQVMAVLQAELSLALAQSSPQLLVQAFHARTITGQRLLDTLCEFCDSYEQWLFNRWLHHVKASDFDVTSYGKGI
jgi:hypothetical protein